MSANGCPPFAPFTVSVSGDAREAVVTPRGELDLASADELTREVQQRWSAGADRVVVDLRPLEFIDSSGLRALLALREAAARERRHFALRPGRSVVQRIFDLTGTSDLFHWH